MVSTYAINHGNEKVRGDVSIDPRERQGGPGRSAVRRDRPVSVCGAHVRGGGADAYRHQPWDARWRRSARGAARGIARRPDARSRRARSGAGGGARAVTVKAALGPARRRDERLRYRQSLVAEAGRRGDSPVHPRSAGRAAKGCARTTRWRRVGGVAGAPVILTGAGLSDAARVREAFALTGASASDAPRGGYVNRAG